MLRHLEFVTFSSGLPPPLPHMQHLSVDLVKITNVAKEDDMKLDLGSRFKAMINVVSLPGKLAKEDYFPLNQTFLLEKPIHPMYQMGMVDQNFDKMRFLAAIGAGSFHVLDLETMQFICDDPGRCFRRTLS